MSATDLRRLAVRHAISYEIHETTWRGRRAAGMADSALKDAILREARRQPFELDGVVCQLLDSPLRLWVGNDLIPEAELIILVRHFCGVPVYRQPRQMELFA